VRGVGASPRVRLACCCRCARAAAGAAPADNGPCTPAGAARGAERTRCEDTGQERVELQLLLLLLLLQLLLLILMIMMMMMQLLLLLLLVLLVLLVLVLLLLPRTQSHLLRVLLPLRPVLSRCPWMRGTRPHLGLTWA